MDNYLLSFTLDIIFLLSDTTNPAQSQPKMRKMCSFGTKMHFLCRQKHNSPP